MSSSGFSLLSSDTRASRRALKFFAAVAVLGFIGSSANGAAIWWDNTNATNLWGTAANWATTAGGGTNPGAAPGSGDTVTFNITSLNTAQTVDLSANQAASSLTFSSTGTTTIQANASGSTARTLAIGTGGLTVSSGAGAVTFNATFGTTTLALVGNESWANNSTNLLNLATNVTNTGNVTPFTLTLNGSGTGGTTISGIISNGGTTGTTALTVNTTGGTTTLSGVNTYTGQTAIQNGTLSVNSLANGGTNSALGAASGANATIKIGNTTTTGTLQYTGAAATTNRVIDLSGTTGGATLDSSGSGAVTFTSALTATGAGSKTLTLTGTNTNANTISGAIVNNSGTNLTSLVKSGAGTWVLSGSNAFSGSTQIQAGTLSINTIGNVNGGNSALGAVTSVANGTIKIGSGATSATLQYTGAAATSNRVIDLSGTTGGATLDSSGSGALTLTSALTASGAGSKTLTLTGTNTNANTISGAIVNNSGTNLTSLVKSGAGTWVLSGSNAFSGSTQIQAGTLSINTIGSVNGGNSALGAVTSVANGTIAIGSTTNTGTLQYTGAAATTNRVVDLAGTTGGATLDSSGSGALTFTSAFTASGAGAKTLTLTGTNTNANTIGGAIVDSGGGATALTKSGAGTWVLSGTNTYTGLTTVSAGVLNVQNASGLGGTTNGTSVTGGATLQLQGGISVGNEALTLNGTGAAGQNGALVNVSSTNNYAGLLTLGSASTISADSGTLNLTNAGTITGSGNGLTLTGTGNGSISSIIGTGAGTLTKAGTGTWTLSGTNTYTGQTAIQNGTLSVNSLANGGTNSALGAASGANATIKIGSTTNAGTLQYTGAAATTDRVIDLAGTTGGATLDSSGSGALTFTSNLTASGVGAKTLTLTGTSGSAATINGNIVDSSSGATSLTKSGSGTWILAGTAKTYTGATTINNGTLQVNGTNVLATPNITVNATTAGTTANFATGSSASLSIGTLTFGGVGGTSTSTNTVTLGSSSTLTLGGNVTYDATGNPMGATVSGSGTLGLGSTARTFTVGDSTNATNDLTISSNISGTGQASGGIVKAGNGNLVVSGTGNTFNGLVTVSAGTLTASNATDASGLGGFALLGDHSWVTGPSPTTVITVNSGATLAVTGQSGVYPGVTTHQYETLSLNGSGYNGAGAINATSGVNTWQGNVTLAGDTTIQNSGAAGDNNALVFGALLFSPAPPTNFALNGHTLNMIGTGDTYIMNSIGATSGDVGGVNINLSTASNTVYFAGTQNYFTGAVHVNQGILQLMVDSGNHANADILSNFTIGDGIGAADTAIARNYYNDQIADGATVTINSDGQFDLGTFGKDETIGPLVLNGGHIVLSNGTSYGNLYLGADVSVHADSKIDGDAVNGGINLNNTVLTPRTFNVDSGTTLTVNAVIGGTGGYIKDGTGTMVITRDNTSGYDGTTEVKNGILNIQKSGGLGQVGSGGAAQGTTVDSGATLQLQNATGDVAVGVEALTLNGAGLSGTHGALENVSGSNNSWAGLITLGSNSTVKSDAGLISLTGQVTSTATTGTTQTLTVDGSGNTTITSKIYDNRDPVNSLHPDLHTGTLALTKNGSGTLTLSNANTFTGEVDVNAGTLVAASTDAFGADFHNNTVTVQNGATLSFTVATTTNTIGALTNTNATSGTAGGVVSLAAGTTLTVNNGSADSFGGRLSGTGLFVKTGAGTLTFTSAANHSTFNFGGTVELGSGAGTLEFQGGSGSGITSTDALFINTLKLDGGNSTLKLTNAYINVGTLIISGNTILDFGTGGASVLNATNIYIASGAVLTVENWTSESDFLFATNTGYATNGGFRLTNSSGTVAVFNAIGSVPEDQVYFQGDPLSPDGSHTTWINNGYDSFTNWEIRPIPEPSTYGAILLGGCLTLIGWKRHRRRIAASGSKKF